MSDKIKKEKIFLNAMDSWFSNFLIETFRTDHLPDSKLQTEFMGTINDKKKSRLPMYFKPKIINFEYNTSFKTDIFTNDIIIYNLNTGCIKEIDYIINGLRALKLDSEKILIIISNIMTWVKTNDKIKTDDNPDDIVFIHPDDIKKEIPKEEKKENEENEENIEQNENNSKMVTEEQNKAKEENNKENKNESKENDLNASKTDQNKTPVNVSKKISKKTLDEIKEEKEETKNVILYYTEKDYLKRKPHYKFIEYKYIENEALLLNQKNNVKVYVLCPGIIYGYGEKTFYSIFRNAILNLPIEEILLDKGRNIIPTIHMRDLINIISKIIEKKPNSYYLLAFDQSNNRSLKYIIKSIYDCIGDSSKMMPIKEEDLIEKNEDEENKENEEQKDNNNANNDKNTETNNEENGENNNENNNEEKIEEQAKKKTSIFSDKKYILSKDFPRELLSIDLKILPSEFLKGEPKKSYYSESDDENKEKDKKNVEYTPLFKWHCPNGIISNTPSIRKEFIRYRSLNSNKILLLGNPYTGKTELSTIISKIFHLPIINSKMIFEFGKKLANINDNNNEIEYQGSQRKNSIEKDLIHDIQKTLKELDEQKAIAEENYNKRKDKKKTDPPFDDNMYYRFNDELMVRILKRRLQENDTTVYGYILDGFPKNHQQAEELFEDIEKGGIMPNSIIIFENVEDDFLINRLKSSENFPKDAKDPQAVSILERANRRLGKVKENKTQEGYKDLVEFFKDEKFEKYFKVLVLDTKKDIFDLVKESQEFIMGNNDNKINQIDDMLNCTDYKYDYIKEQEELKRLKEEELQKEGQENDKNDKNNKDKKGEKDNKVNDDKNAKNTNEDIQEEKIEEKKEENENEKEKEKEEIKEEKKEEQKIDNNKTEIEEEKKEIEIPKTQYEIEKENEFKLLEKKSEVLRRYLAENVLPLLSLGILHVANERPDDPVEALADFLLAKSFEIEKEEEERKNNEKNKEGKNEDKNNDKEDNKNGNENKNVNNDNKTNKENKEEQNKLSLKDDKNLENKLEKQFSPIEIDFNINEAKEF